LLLYARVWKSYEDAGIADFGGEGDDRAGEEDEGVDEDEDEIEDEVYDGTEDATAFSSTMEPADSGIRGVDTMKDARKLYPWPSGLQEIVSRLWGALSPSYYTESREMVMLEGFQVCSLSACESECLREPAATFSGCVGYR
jgi:hypothetical protein